MIESTSESVKVTSTDPIITIDGPAASGKSTISKKVALVLGWDWVSTGAFYRAIGLLSLRKDVDLNNEKQVLAAFEMENWSIEMAKDQTKVFIDDVDVSDQIYQEEVGSAASAISQFQAIRKAILKSQRDCYSNIESGKGLIAEGRDCGSVIFPAAALKVFLTADAELRAKRRAEQEGLDPSKVLRDQKERDQRDGSRNVAPMIAPEDAFILDTTDMDLDEAVDLILTRAKKAFDITP